MLKTYSIPIETMTPIWTGDNNRETSYLRATSFIGGLRFWTEALLRSFGYKICDVTNQGCIHEPEKEKKACPGCQIFGCTGLSRSFQMQIVPDGKIKSQPHEIVYRKQRKELATLVSKGLSGKFKLKLVPLRPEFSNTNISNFSYALIGLFLLLKWGTIGARDQYGHGLVKAGIDKDYIVPIKGLIEEERKNTKQKEKKQKKSGLSFENFFFFKADIDYNKVSSAKEAFNFRAAVRRQFSKEKNLRHYFCGSLRKIYSNDKIIFDKAATNYNFAIVDNKVIGWGAYPVDGPFGSYREHCLDILQNELHKFYPSYTWKEFNSNRDNCNSPKDFEDYLFDMIDMPWSR